MSIAAASNPVYHFPFPFYHFSFLFSRLSTNLDEEFHMCGTIRNALDNIATLAGEMLVMAESLGRPLNL